MPKSIPTFITPPRPSQKSWAVDFDSVLADLLGHQCATVQAATGTVIAPSEIDDWHWWDGHPLESLVWGDDCYRNRAWTLAMPAIRGGAGALRRLEDRGDRIVIVSDREAYMQSWLQDWLILHDMNYPVVVTNKVRSKAEIAETLGLRFTIDDSPHQIDTYQQSGVMSRIYIFDQPHNQFVPATDNTTRVRNWRHFIGKELNHR